MKQVYFSSILVISIFGILSKKIVSSQSFGHDGSVQELTLLGTIIAWNLFPTVLASKSNGRKKVDLRDQEDNDNGSESSNKLSIIDDILRKAEIAKAEQKESKDKVILSENNQKIDPLKCFPKALCGVSSEVEQISKRKKNGLISEYLVLMKAVTRHPEFLDDVVSSKNTPKEKTKSKNKPSSDDVPNNDATSDSEEDDENNESDEEEDEEDDEDNGKRKTKKKKQTGNQELVPKDDEKFNEAYLKEKIEMETLIKETMQKEEQDRDKFWGDDDQPPKRRPNPFNSSPWRRPPPTRRPWGFGSGGGGYQSRPPPRRPGFGPFFRREEPADGSLDGTNPGSNTGGGLTSYIANLFGFGESSLTNDPWFASAARDLSGEVGPGIAIDETREILETAIDIGRSFEKPTQCNEIFNACDQYDYTELLYMIDDLRRNVREKVEKEQGKKNKSKKTKKEKAKSEIPSKNSQTRLKSEQKKQKRPSLTSTDDMSGDGPERYVIPVTTPSSTIADTFALPNVFSWLG